MKKVIFWSNWHNGDVHTCRNIIKQIMKKIHFTDPNVIFEFSHKNDPTLLADIPNLGYNREAVDTLNPHDSLVIQGDTVFINTWYDQQHQKFARANGILTFDTLYAAIDDSCQQAFGFNLGSCSEEPIDFFPSIDYEKFYIEHAKEWLVSHPGKKVIIENGKAMSNQAINFDMTSIIAKLAEKHPKITFILSQNDHIPVPDNVFFTSDIIQKEIGKTDLNEISYLSTHCDVIIGRASGVFTFSITRDNLFDRKARFICFSHLLAHQKKYWLGRLFEEKVDYSSSFVIDRTSNVDEVYRIIGGQL
jgi:hypothetical protein